MKTKDETVRWFEDEIRTIKNNAVRDRYTTSKTGNNIDSVSLNQIAKLEKQLEEHLRSNLKR
jgi:hypothetical protein